MKTSKIIKTLVTSMVITASLACTASALYLQEVSPCHTFEGRLYGYSGYAEASTTIIATNYNGGSNAYVYIESLDEHGYRVNANQDYEIPKAYTSVGSSRANGGYRSRHTVKDPECANRYLRLE